MWFCVLIVLLNALAMLAAEPICPVEKFGGDPTNKDYGSWYLCTSVFNSTAPSVISIGSGCDSTFEIQILQKYPNARVEVFDPTISVSRFDGCYQRSATALGLTKDTVPPKPMFWKIGLGPKTEYATFKRSENPNIGSLSASPYVRYHGKEERQPVIDLPRLLSFTGIPDVLKIDIEGYEYTVFRDLCKLGKLPQVPQILLELEERLMKDDGSLQFSRKDMLDCFQNSGYVVNHSGTGPEVSFVLKR